MELEVLILEDTAGGRVTVGDAEQPVLFTAGATRQFCQQSQLQGKTQTHHCPAACLETAKRGTERWGAHLLLAAVRKALTCIKKRVCW